MFASLCCLSQSYIIYYSIDRRDMDNEVVKKLAKNTTTNLTSLHIETLKACEVYNFKVQVHGPKGLGPLSSMQSDETDAGMFCDYVYLEVLC